MLAKDIDGGFSRFFLFSAFFSSSEQDNSFSKSSAKRAAIVQTAQTIICS
jgi:hypothetical protein